jgi:hypothetical protein
VLLSCFLQHAFENKSTNLFLKIAFVLGILVLSIHYLDPVSFINLIFFEIAVTSLLVVVFCNDALVQHACRRKKFYYVTVGIIMYLLGSTVLFFVGDL